MDQWPTLNTTIISGYLALQNIVSLLSYPENYLIQSQKFKLNHSILLNMTEGSSDSLKYSTFTFSLTFLWVDNKKNIILNCPVVYGEVISKD